MKNLYAKLFKIQGLAVSKKGYNPHFKSGFINLDTIVEVLAPLLVEHELIVYHYSSKGFVNTVVADIESEEKITSEFEMIDSNKPQELGSCITYAKRYNLGQLFNIVTDADDDAQVCSPKAAVNQKAATTFKETPKTNGSADLGKCKDCGADNKLSQANKPYCGKLCWKG